MTEPTLLQRLLVWVLRMMLVAVGAVFALAVLCGIAVLLVVWGVKRLWARVTGKPVAPWVLRTDPLAVWRHAANLRAGRAAPFSPAAGPVRRADEVVPPSRIAAHDVTDVTPK